MSERRIKDVMLERYLADALSEEARGRIEAQLQLSPADQQRLHQLRADAAAFLLRHPPSTVLSKLSVPRSTAFRGWWLAALMASGLATWLVVVRPGEDETALYTAKGAVTLSVHLKVGEESQQVVPGTLLRPGDAIRFELRAPGTGYVAVIGRDAVGTVTVYHPFGGTAAVPYQPTETLLATAIELDEVTGREELFALYRSTPFDLTHAVQALEARQPLDSVLADLKVAHTFIDKQ